MPYPGRALLPEPRRALALCLPALACACTAAPTNTYGPPREVLLAALGPLFAMLLLKTLVFFRLVFVRMNGGMQADMRVYKTYDPELVRQNLPRHEVQAMRNLANLGELPPMFHVLCIVALFLPEVATSTTFAICSWMFVLSRYVHSYVHCTSNSLRWRPLSFVISCLFLLALLIHMAAALFLG